MKPIHIVRPQLPTLPEFDAPLDDILRSGLVTNNGRWVQQFERELSEYLGAPTIVFSSGQAALMTMLAVAINSIVRPETLDDKIYAAIRSGVFPIPSIKRQMVICPSFTFCATPHAIRWAGGEPIFCEINPQTLLMDDMALDELCTQYPEAIVLGVDPYGIPWRHKPRNTLTLNDSAASFGAMVDGKVWGTEHHAQIFSFHATKAFTTMEGGALCSQNPEFIETAKAIRNFGQGADGDCAVPGLNGKMMEICAIIGLRQLEQWHQTIWRRQDVADDMWIALKDIPGLIVIDAPPNVSPTWLYRPVLIDSEKFGMDRDAVVAALKRFEINVRTYYGAAHQLACYRPLGYNLPATEGVASQVIALPIYNDMRQSEIERIADALRGLQAGRGY